MKTERITCGGQSAVLYGEPSDKVYLFIHGKSGRKEEAADFAPLVPGWQVLAVDLPGHGERQAELADFDPWHAVPELQGVMQAMRLRWPTLALRANSIGAWFGMLAGQDVAFANCLLVSPLVDMQRLIYNMMGWANVTEEQLEREGRIETAFGETLSWQYLQYAAEHADLRWTSPTAILYAGRDNLTSRETIDRFVARNHCRLTVMEDGEHWFHTPEQLTVLSEWTRANA